MRAIVAMVVLAAACRDTSGPSAEQINAWKALVEEEAARVYERPPLVGPGLPGSANDDYREAARLAQTPDGYPKEHWEAANDYIDGKRSWAELPEEVKAFAAGPQAMAIAELVLRGAGHKQARSLELDFNQPNPMTGELMVTMRSSRAVLLAASAAQARGEVMRAGWLTLAVLQMQVDQRRGGATVGAMAGPAYEAKTLGAFRRVVVDPRLGPGELAELSAAYRRIIAAMPTWAEAQRTEAAFSAAIALLPDSELSAAEADAVLRYRKALELLADAPLASQKQAVLVMCFETGACGYRFNPLVEWKVLEAAHAHRKLLAEVDALLTTELAKRTAPAAP